MLISKEELDKIEDKKLRKTITRLNKALDKEDQEKARQEVQKLEDIVQANASIRVPTTYVLSIVVEEHPELLTSIEQLMPYLNEDDEKVILNVLVCFGFYLLHNIANATQAQVSLLVTFIKHSDKEVRETAYSFLESIPGEYFFMIKQEALELLDQLKNEPNPKFQAILVKFLNRMIDENIHFAQRIEKRFIEFVAGDVPREVELLVFEGFKKINPALKNPEDMEKAQVLELQANRPPIVKIHNLEKISKELGISLDDVKEKYRELRDTGLIAGFFYLKRKRKNFIEFELERMVDFLGAGRKKVEELKDLFSLNDSQLEILVKTLVKERLLRGYLSKIFFYSHDSIKQEIMDQYIKTGEIQISDFSSFINEKYVKSVIREFADSSKTIGFFDRHGEKYHSLKNILRNIEREASKASIIDLSHYKTNFHPDDYYKIKDEVVKKYCTDYRAGSVYLTNIGKIRIEQALLDAEKIGYANLEKIEANLGIPVLIIENIAKDRFKRKNGFWNQEGKNFYFFKYLEGEIEKVKTSLKGAPDKIQDALSKMSTDLGLSVENINARLKAKQEQIGEKILKQDSIELNEYMKMLDMKRTEFLEFIDTLDRPYLETGNRVIFSPDKIREHKRDIENILIRDSRRQSTLELTDLQGKYKLKSTIIGEILNNLIDNEKITGFWIGGDRFVTEFGIEQTIRDQSTGGMFWIDDIFEDHELSDADRALVIDILQDLIARGTLEGAYDPEEGSFFTFDAKSEMDKNMAIQGLDAVYNGIVEKLNAITHEIGKAILEVESVKPQLMQKIEDQIEDTVKKLIGWEREIQNFVYRRSRFLPNWKEDPEVKAYLEEFEEKKKLFWGLENRFPEIVALKTRLRMNPDNKDAKRELEVLYKRFGFSN